MPSAAAASRSDATTPPLTLVTGLYGMNVPLPHFPGGEAAQFWWLFGLMIVVVIGMLSVFRSNRWI